MADNNIIRYAGDTYPTTIIIKVNGIPVDLSKDWQVDLRYKDGGVLRIVDCVIADPHSGLVYIYPHSRVENAGYELTPDKFVTDDEATADPSKVSNQCWTSAGEYEYSVVRHKKFGTYEEKMTHLVGKIKILEAV